MRKKFFPLLLIPALVVGAGATAVSPLFQKKLTGNQKILHALNRLTYGPRSGDMEHVKKIGLKKWIDLQLNPLRIPESPELEAKLKPLDSLTMETRTMIDHYPPQQIIAAAARGIGNWNDMPKDPVLKARLERMAGIYRKRIAGEKVEPSKKRLEDVLEPAQLETFRNGSPQAKVDLINSLPEEKLTNVFLALPPNTRNQLFAVSSSGMQRKYLASVFPQQVISYDLNEAKLLRAVYSNRQLEEVLADFWYNHFNVFIDKGNDRFLVTSYERNSIRPYVLGKFKDMLLATAQDPAMLYYLDNWQSQAAQPAPPKGARTVFRPSRGLNENYARELLELHTLGVDGGYTQKDIIEVARCLTGWTIKDPRRGSEFEFNARMHDKGEKVVLGVTIPAGGGKEDGLKVLDILVHHPSTGRFISRKLAQRFVADEPPSVLIDRMAKTFREKDGDLREVMKTMLGSKEFWSQGAYRAKMKSPLEMVASSIRATGADVQSAFLIANQLQQLGQPLYRKLEPTGYSSANAEWMNSASLLARMNFALALTQNKVPGLKMDPAKYEKNKASDSICKAVLFTEPSAETRAVIEKGRQGANGASASKIAGLVLGSPEFQRR